MAADAPAANPAPGRLRLKPKLYTETAAEADTGAVNGGPSLQSAGADGGGGARLKLKPAAAVTTEPLFALQRDEPAGRLTVVHPACPPTAKPEAGANPAPANPVERLSADEGAQGQAGAAPAMAAAVVPPAAGALAKVKAPAIKPKAAPRHSRLMLVGVFALVLLGGGAGAFFFLMQKAPPPAHPIPFSRLPPKTVTAPVLAVEPLPAAPAIAPADATPAPKPANRPVAPVMSPAFRLWIEAARINGVSATPGVAPRVIINGRLVRLGDTVDASEGISFHALDVERRMLMFRNRAGMVAGKGY
jgi:hypothetical protein